MADDRDRTGRRTASAARALNADFDWSLCRVFLAVLRHGSMSAAAEELGESRPTVRRQVERLELELGSPLFTRSTDGVRPTPLAHRLRAVAEEIEAGAYRFRRLAGLDRRSGTVRIGAEGLLGSRLLPPVLKGLAGMHPDLRFAHVGSAMPPNVLRRDADVALSWTRATQESVVATRLGTVDFGLFAGIEWSGEHAAPSMLDDAGLRRTIIGGLVEHRLLGGGAERPPSLEEAFAVWSDDEDFCLGAAEASLGAAVIPLSVGVARPGLSRVMPERSFRREVWAAVHPDLRRVPEIRLVMDALRVAFAAG